MQNYFLEDEIDGNSGPFIEDIQFQYFLSFDTSQIKWAKAYSTFQIMEYDRGLWVKGEPQNPYTFLSSTNNS